MLSILVNQLLYKRYSICETKEPKTTHSRRHVVMTPKLAIFLREYRAEREWFGVQLDKPLTLDSLVLVVLKVSH